METPSAQLTDFRRVIRRLTRVFLWELSLGLQHGPCCNRNTGHVVIPG